MGADGIDAWDAPAVFYDGLSAGKIPVRATLRIETSRLEISSLGGEVLQSWPFEQLRRMQDSAQEVFYLASNTAEARLIFDSEADAKRVAAVAPKLDKSAPLGRQWSKLILWTSGALAAFALILFVLIPNLADQLARFVPEEQEHKLGRSVVRYLERNLTSGEGLWTCKDPAGVAALETMSARLMDGKSYPAKVTIEVVDHPMVNAFAVPGGSVVLMKGLIERAESPDEVAAVLAHELGHVATRDPIRMMMRTAGTAGMLSLLFGDATGGAFVTIMGDALLRAKYSRNAERAADLYALASLERVSASPEALATFFERLQKEPQIDLGALNLFASHPALEERALTARVALQDKSYVQILSAQEWQDLRGVCDS
ncbi:MAG: M48 family metallopeptidase [Pseudomonadota bacterium]